MRIVMASAALLLGLDTQLALAASDPFHVAYNVERADASKLSTDTCAEIAQREAGDYGYVHAVDRTPGQLIVVSGGPADGGASFLVYCIAVDNKTAYVVQGIDYSRQKSSAGALADRVHKALLEAGK